MPCVYGGPLYICSFPPSFGREGFLYKNNMGKLNKIFKISSTDFATLKETGQITKAGVTYKYDPDNLYLIENNLTDDYVLLGAGGSKLESELSVKKAVSADAVIDCESAGQTIKIGYSGAGINTSTFKYFAGYTTRPNGAAATIKNISLNETKNILGLKSMAFNTGEAYLTWGGQNLSGNISPVDMAMSNVHSANRLSFGNANGITIEYSTDGGTTWIDYGVDDEGKISLVSNILDTESSPQKIICIGKKGLSEKAATTDMLRITLDALKMNIYTYAKKVLININTNGATGCYVKISRALIGTPNTFIEEHTYAIDGWSGWNSIPYPYTNFGGYPNQSNNTGKVRFTFGITGVSDTYNSRLHVYGINLYGDTYFSYNSEMAKSGHLYSYDYKQNAIFPGTIKGTELIEGSTTLSNKYAPLSSVPESLTTTDIDDAIK